MAWFSESDYPQIPLGSRSLVVSFCNLMLNLGVPSDYDPSTLYTLLTRDDPEIDWWALPEYVDNVDLGHVEGDNPSFPTQNNSIVKFRRMDTDAGGLIDHYCLVLDITAESIVDPLDGIIKSAKTYGESYGWTSYVAYVGSDAEYVDEPNTYRLGHRETFWDAMRKLSLNAEAVIDLNDFDDPRNLKQGDIIHLPDRSKEEKNVITYQLLPEPVAMHIKKEGGTRKVTFGNANTWANIQPTGRLYEENSNHTIVAIAQVTLEEEDATAAYYLERIDLGEFEKTGRPRYTIGFNHSHLAEGQVIKAVTPLEPEVIEAIEEAETVFIEEQRKEVVQALEVIDRVEPVVEEPTVEHKPQTMDFFVAPTDLDELKPIRGGQVVKYVALDTIEIKDMAGLKPPRILKRNQQINLSYTFDDGKYGLPSGHEKSRLRYGIPMDMVEEDIPLYDWSLDDDEGPRVIQGLSTRERGVVVLSKVLSQGTRLKTLLIQKTLKRR